MAGNDTPIGVLSIAAGFLTKHLAMKEPNRSLCGRCRGSKFDSFVRSRASRKCPQCKGDGSVPVGHTKR